MIYAEVYPSPLSGECGFVPIPDGLLPEHIYCDTCGDCIRCSPHDEESWCRTGGRWVLELSDPDDAALVAAAKAVMSPPAPEQGR